MAAFLEVVTRCYKRPKMLEQNILSLKAQTDPDYAQVFLVDNVGKGVAWANDNLGRHLPAGDYVWVLDDDDVCIRETLVAELKAIVAAHAPDVIMIKMDHGALGVLPDAGSWGGRPLKTRVGSAAIVVTRETWLRHAKAWMIHALCADFSFIEAVFQDSPRVYWHDVVASRVQRISQGRPE